MSCSTLKTAHRTALSSFLLHHFSPSGHQTLLKGGCRTYITCFSNYSTNVYKRDWLKLGLPMLDIIGVRAIHGTATVSMSTRDFYEVLGVSKNATSSEMKKAYYALAKELHPDKNKDNPEADKQFQEVQRAYEVLKDDETRVQYDQFGEDGGAGFHPFGGNPFHDIFGNTDIFGRDMGGEDVKVSVELSFMEAVTGCTKNVTFQADFSCGTCGGTGIPPGTRPATCKRCKGSGMITSQSGFFEMQSTCPNCKGSGKIVRSFCKTCKGIGVTKGKKSLRLDLVPGIDNDEILKIHGSGGADPEGRQPGDLFVTVKVREDPVFRRERSDIHVDIVLSITQAILGGTVQVPTLTGNSVVKVRPGMQPGQKVMLKKKGIKTKRSHSFGDQYVHFSVSIPSNLTPRQREIMEEFAKEEQADYDKGAAAAAAASG